MKIPHALCKHNIRFLGELPYRKGKISCHWMVIFLWVIKMKLYWFIAAFRFLKDEILKILAVAFKVLYFITVLNLNSILFYQWLLPVLFAYFVIGTKIFCFFKKNESSFFWMRVHFKWVGSQVLQNFEEGCL